MTPATGLRQAPAVHVVRRMAGLLVRHAQRAARTVMGVDKRIARRHLAAASAPKLHLGCGDNVLAGWLNSDSSPRAGVLRLDATRRFPFPANTFAYVYSEHLLGSLSFRGAAAMLRESCRVLAPGGMLRIATPDLAFLIGLCNEDLKAEQAGYIEWFLAETGLPGAPAALVVNHYMRAWRLAVVYDEPMLREALQAAGFVSVTRRGLNESNEAPLRGLANERRLPPGLLRLESLVLEATKPG